MDDPRTSRKRLKHDRRKEPGNDSKMQGQFKFRPYCGPLSELDVFHLLESVISALRKIFLCDHDPTVKSLKNRQNSSFTRLDSNKTRFTRLRHFFALCCLLFIHSQLTASTMMKGTTVVALLLQCVSLLVSASLRGNDTEEPASLRALREFADCNDCFCVPDKGDACPTPLKPQTDWSALIPTLRGFELTNSPSLTCDPYTDESCAPPSREEDGVCVVEITPPSSPSNTCPDGYTYTLKTYEETVEEAQNAGRYVTHSNPCGVCSTLQDLAAYVEQGAQLRSSAQRCGMEGFLGKHTGTKCFMELGFTEACASMWYYNTLNTRRKCRWKCWAFYLFNKDPNTGPQCELASCLECDETESGPLFDIFAGRTRRNSGLLSNIVRTCSEMQVLPQPNPCA